MSESKEQSAASATAKNIHSIRAFACCADGDRPHVKSPRKSNRVAPQLIWRATEVDGIRVGGQSGAHKAEQRPSDSVTDRSHARWLGGAVPRSHRAAELIGDKIVDRSTRHALPRVGSGELQPKRTSLVPLSISRPR
jgi:hypothetical protein